MDVGQWLSGLGLPQYIDAFQANEVHPGVLKKLTAEDLKEVGVGPVGHRRQILSAIEELSEADLSSRGSESERSGPERRHLTVLFCDLVGSTAMAASMDPEDFRDVIRRYHKLVADVVAAQGGFVAQFLGDGALIYFGYPAAHENDAERAVSTALALVQAASGIQVNGEGLQVRAGMATGLVVVGDRAEGSQASQEPRIMGETPNLAARLQGLATPGGVLIDAATRRLIGRTFNLSEGRATALKGFEAPVSCWAVLGEAGVESRFEALRSQETPLIGRDEELQLLEKRWEQVKAGSGRVVMISGEPGLGKSRLMAAFRERIRPDRPVELRYFCSPQHTSTALYPIATQLARSAGFEPGDSPDDKLFKVRALVPASEDLPLIAELLGLPKPATPTLDGLAPQEKRERLFGALLRIIQELASDPVFLLFEDTHWLDPTSLDLLHSLIERVAGLKVLLALTFRPEFQPPWTGQANVSSITLSRLDAAESIALVRELTNRAPICDELVHEIADRTDGIPLFAEEFAKAVLERRDGEMLSSISKSGLNVPSTLHASLMARLDHLGSEAREIAQIASVIGRECEHYMLIQLMTKIKPVEAQRRETSLDALIASGLLLKRGHGSAARYSFKHALIQDAAYSTLLREQRQHIHAAAAGIFEQAGNIAAEVLAYHFGRGGQPDKEADYWTKAGHAACEQGAHREAVVNFQYALQVFSKLSESNERMSRQLDILSPLCGAMVAGSLSADRTPIIARAEELAQRLGVSLPNPIITHRVIMLISTARYGEAIELARAFRHQAVLPGLVDGLLGLATYMSGGQLEQALEYNQNALNEARDPKDRFLYSSDPVCSQLSDRSLMLTMRGFLDTAQRYEAESIQRAVSLNHTPTLHRALTWKLGRCVFVRDYEGIVSLSDVVIAKNASRGFNNPWPWICKGLGLVGVGECEAGIRAIEDAIAEFETIKFFTQWRSMRFSIKAHAYELAGNLTKALDAAKEALEVAEEMGEKVLWSDTLREYGELCIARGDPGDVLEGERLLLEAIAFAQQQQCMLFELRASAALARLWRDQARYAEAQELLRPAYSRFTEGPNTRDLVAAKELLGDIRTRLKGRT